ncbi:MAG: UrcA family protein [Terricaulis sp.]
MHRLSFALAALSVLALAAPAVAEEQVSNVPQVSLSDLDLNTPAGVDSALNRMRRASRDDCGMDDVRHVDIGIYVIIRACVRDDTAAQVDRLGNDTVRARYQERQDYVASWR